MIFFVSTPGISYLIRGMRVSSGIHWAIVRPYELIAIILMIFGLFLFSRGKKQYKWWSGLIGGIVTLLSINFAFYYALSLLVYSILRAIKTRNYKTHISSLIITGFITFNVSTVYTLPYFISVL